ncbi:hypothetical protein J5N97_019793 [Dioscorea zingiberensis]|uniref:Uncharacterized protein n=1 Tax=Dioscorea zingiberensis TaxID=325984 RepID=A0A9D5CFC2_9LILI|nr:hypothetical protein J5N97_019793 [Dioscorea zingiberensis]
MASITITIESWECSDFQEINSTLLMEMLEESYMEEVEDDPNLDGVMRSFEAEIGDGLDACQDCRVDDIFSDLEGHDCSGSASFGGVDGAFDWVEMEVVPGPSGGDMGEWYMEVCLGDSTAEMLGGYEEEYPRDYCSMYYGECSADQVYSSLWE